MAGRKSPGEQASGQPRDPAQEAPWAVPDEVVAQAKGAFRQRTEGEVASLVFDSLVDEDAPAPAHRLRFEHPVIQLDVYVSTTAEGSRLSVETHPPAWPS